MRFSWFVVAVCAAAAMLFAGSVSAQRRSHARGDSREALTLSPAEAAEMLSGMRTYLETVQGIVSALAENKVARVPEIAARSGAKLLGSMNPITGLKAPIGFTMMSLDTHDKFDKLAEKARRGTSRTEVLTDLQDILGNCTGCHAAYRLAR
ncbi:hypothetical protein HYPDE_25498 [Hyphomicrobium denitrificans 1NES1]|uniref:Cytochrome C n=2 Tax=Hyphomicrobium denitrificans TaxID=53399 RepID=N0B007_9HYPH|nr:hypothetical protein HYPDE_25498 [Hyphomicrobium denitrificans 1NES1]